MVRCREIFSTRQSCESLEDDLKGCNEDTGLLIATEFSLFCRLDRSHQYRTVPCRSINVGVDYSFPSLLELEKDEEM